ncbi:phage antirepressor N-terminal domain-containing protein [Pragia fontium]|uniref:phage antirepressor N-terminal domain-containing protein n=1 Tax=Pragia fontium TaxID=82985 RepID=UPI000F8307E0|nr:phage antirepressor N-terminal domain-containing protein [Pragia fontium]
MNNITSSSNACPAVTVPFHGASLFLTKYNDEPYVPMKPVVEGMGLDWKSQHAKISQRFSKGMVEITIPTKGGDQLMSCLPLRKLPAWLYSIQPNKVKAEIRDKVLQYQEECDEVLWQYWTKGEAKKPAVRAAVKSYLPEYRKARAAKMAAETMALALSFMPNLSDISKQTAMAKAVNDAAGVELLPLPAIEEHYYTAGEIGELAGISAQKVGRLANANNLKTEEFGKYFMDKSAYSSKQVEAFRYNQKGVEAITMLARAAA